MVGILQRWDEHNQRVIDRQLKAPPPEPISSVLSLVVFAMYIAAMVSLIFLPWDMATKLRVQLAINVIGIGTLLVMAIVYARRHRRREQSTTPSA